MSNSTVASLLQDPASPLYTASQRLFRALDRLENAVRNQSVTQERDTHRDQHLVVFERENNQLRQERDQLNQAIAQLETQYAELHKVATAIHGRLDDSIGHLTHILEE